MIAEELWASLDPSPDRTVEKAWARDGESRIKDLDEGRGKLVPLEDARVRIAHLASQAASFVTGEIIVVDGGSLASGVNQ